MTTIEGAKSIASGRVYYWAVAAAALGGVVAGVALAPRLAFAPPAGNREVVVRPVVSAPNETRSDDKRQLAALEMRLSQLEATSVDHSVVRQLPPETEAAEPADQRAAPVVSPEAAREHFLGLMAERRTRHANEPVDRPWARTAEAGFQADLQRMGSAPGAGGFSLQKVECKTTSCSADLLFADYQSVSSQSSRLLHEQYSQPCGTTVFAPEPAAPNEPYVLTVYFECDSRKGL